MKVNVKTVPEPEPQPQRDAVERTLVREREAVCFRSFSSSVRSLHGGVDRHRAHGFGRAREAPGSALSGDHSGHDQIDGAPTWVPALTWWKRPGGRHPSSRSSMGWRIRFTLIR